MKRIILTHKSNMPSARLLRDALEEITDKRILLSVNGQDHEEILIRYGNSTVFSNIKIDTKFNDPDVIKLACNKLAFSNLMHQNNIPSPTFYFEERPENFPVLIRKTLCSFKGKGIVIINSSDEFDDNFRDGYCWTPFINMEYELRVHLFDNKVIKIFKKVCLNQEEKYPIRTSDNYHFHKVDEGGNFKRLMEICEHVSEIMNAGFIALDIGKLIGGGYIFLEANSAPGLNLATAYLYANLMVEQINVNNWSRESKNGA